MLADLYSGIQGEEMESGMYDPEITLMPRWFDRGGLEHAQRKQGEDRRAGGSPFSRPLAHTTYIQVHIGLTIQPFLPGGNVWAGFHPRYALLRGGEQGQRSARP